MNSVLQDIHYALRQLRKSPGFTAVAILTLALGIGANTAVFQLIDAVRLRALPVKHPQELRTVRVEIHGWLMGSTSGPYSDLTFPLFDQLRRRQEAFSAIAAWGQDDFNLATGGEVHMARGIWVSGDFFRVLELQPVRGRLIAASDDQPGCASPGVNISYSFWQRRYGGQSSAVGSKLTLDGHPFEIIGVAPPSFHGVSVGDSFDVAVPLCVQPVIQPFWNRLTVREAWWLAAIGRLRPGWTNDKATAQLNAISQPALQETVPPMYDAEGVKHYLGFKFYALPASTGYSALRQESKTPLSLLLGISGLVLLIACANLANLMLARASGREREIVVRVALGAARSRLIRQLLSESLLLSFAGALAGKFLAAGLARILVSLMSTANNPLFLDFTIDWRMLGFTVGLAVLTTVLFGLLPAFRATRASPSEALKSGGRGLTAGRERFDMRRGLVAVQVAVSLVLLVGALLFVRSFQKLITLDAGFRQDGILITQINFTKLDLPHGGWLELRRELLTRLRAIPGVQSAADTNLIPVSGNTSNNTVLDDKDDSHKGNAWTNFISPGYFQTLGTPLLTGRDFNDRDTTASPRVAIVNQEFVRKFLGGGAPIGRTFRTWQPPGTPVPAYEIVGTVEDTKYQDLHEEAQPITYFPVAQSEHPWQISRILIRSDLDLSGLTSSIKAVLDQFNPALDIEFHSFKTQIRDSLLQDRLMAALSSFFALLAALLAAVGLYGVISYLVVQRTTEIGIRVALGAQRGDVLRMVLRDAGLTTLFGLVAGAALALATAQVTRSLLFGLKPRDPLTIASAVMLLAAIAALAAFIPAKRAAKVDPMVALRYE